VLAAAVTELGAGKAIRVAQNFADALPGSRSDAPTLAERLSISAPGTHPASAAPPAHLTTTTTTMPMTTATATRVDDDDLRLLDGVQGLRSTRLIGRQRHSLGCFRREGQTDGCDPDGCESAGQDSSEEGTAIDCCHFFSPLARIAAARDLIDRDIRRAS
jgi:hypothetical protein